MTNERMEMLARNVPLFEGIGVSDVEKIFSKGRTMRVQKGQALFYEDTVGDEMYIVLGGTISLFKNKKHLADLGAGSMLGEMALVSQEPRSASAIAGEDSMIFVLEETTFDKLMTKRVAIRMLMNIIKTLCNRLRDTNKRATTV